MTPFDYHTSATCAVRSTGWRIRTCHRGRSELSRELVEPLSSQNTVTLEHGHTMLCPYSLNTGHVTMICETQ